MARLELTASTDALPALLQRVRAGTDVLAIGPRGTGRLLLDAAAEALQAECRVVQVAGGPTPLSLSGLMAQVAGNEDLSAQDDSVVESGYRRLAVPDAAGRRIALLISDAGQLQRPALRFVQHVARNAPPLLLVLAGGPELDELLEEADFAGLRARLPAAVENEAPVQRERLSSVSQRGRRTPVWLAAGLCVAASAAIAAWALRVSPRQPEDAVPLVAERERAPKPESVAAIPAPIPPHREPTSVSAPPVPEPTTQQAVLAQPAPVPTASAEPERSPAPPRQGRQADARAKDQPARVGVRRAHAVRPAEHGREPERPAYWAEDVPRPVYGGPAPPYWGRPGYAPWGAPSPPPSEGPYIGTYTADGRGFRTFRYEGAWR